MDKKYVQSLTLKNSLRIPVSILSGVATGYILCPTLNYIMSVTPVPYSWIANQPAQLRLPIFLAGAYALFVFTSTLTVGVSAVILGYLYKTQVALTSMLIFASVAVTYCRFVLDQTAVTDFSNWIRSPMSWFYLAEIAGLCILCASMVWVGSIFGRAQDYYRDHSKQISPVH